MEFFLQSGGEISRQIFVFDSLRIDEFFLLLIQRFEKNLFCFSLCEMNTVCVAIADNHVIGFTFHLQAEGRQKKSRFRGESLRGQVNLSF